MTTSSSTVKGLVHSDFDGNAVLVRAMEFY